MKEKANILIIEDALIFAQGLQLMLLQHPIVQEVKIAGNIDETLKIVSKEPIDIVFLDLNLEEDRNGFEIARILKKDFPHIKIIVLTQHARIDIFKKLFQECKVDAYLDKQLGLEESYQAITAVLSDEKYIDNNIKEILKIQRGMKVSHREKQVLGLLQKGMIQKEIAVSLNISPRTVEQHIKNLLKRFKLKNSTELVATYLEYIHRIREDSSNRFFEN